MSAAAETSLHDFRLPNESPDYRAARDELLRAEMDLRRQIESVAALRRELPQGGAVAEDYVFDEETADGTIRQVKLSELFNGKQTLAVYNFMYSAEMEAACPSCTAVLDSLDGAAQHVNQPISFVVVAKSPIGRITAYARERGWDHLRLLSSANNTYNVDYGGQAPQGYQLPALNIFTQRDGVTRHFYNAELLFAPSEPGQHPRHVDIVWPLWGMLDFTPEGRAPDWLPRRNYDES